MSFRIYIRLAAYFCRIAFSAMLVALTYPAHCEQLSFTSQYAFISGNSMTAVGSSHYDIYWGRVCAKGDIDVMDLAPLQSQIDIHNPAQRITMETDSNPNKLHIAGIDTNDDIPDVGVERWVRWHASGMLYLKTGSTRFELIPRWFMTAGTFTTQTIVAGTPLTSQQQFVSDLFGQLLNAPGASIPGPVKYNGFSNGWDINSLDPTLQFLNHLPPNGAEIYYDQPNLGVYPTGHSVLVQKSSAVADYVDDTLTTAMNYNLWKEAACRRNGYARPTGSGFVDIAGVPLYVDETMTLVPWQGVGVEPPGLVRFTNFTQLSVAQWVPPSGETSSLAGRILFIDTPEGTSTGTLPTYEIQSGDSYFWKGALYVCGHLEAQGAADSPTILMRNPAQYAEQSGGYMVPRCFLEGVLYVAGSVTRMTPTAIYGTVIAKEGATPAGLPAIYYNSADIIGDMVLETPVAMSEFTVY